MNLKFIEMSCLTPETWMKDENKVYVTDCVSLAIRVHRSLTFGSGCSAFGNGGCFIPNVSQDGTGTDGITSSNNQMQLGIQQSCMASI